MKFFFVALITLSFSLFGNFSLQDRLKRSEKGNFVVTEQGKTISVLLIRSVEKNIILLEEISLPSYAAKGITDWGKWLEQRAPGHASWVMYEIDMEKKELLEAFSFSRRAWLMIDNKSFIAHLLSLPLQLLPDEKRRKIGPPPAPGERDHRPLWNPPLMYEGKKYSHDFIVYYAKWPKDETELSGKLLEMYFDKNEHCPFPFWIQFSSGHGSVFAKVIDSGKNLSSPYQELPRRYPGFTGPIEKADNFYQVQVRCPRYFQEFELYAVDEKNDLTLLQHTIAEKSGEEILVQFSMDELEEKSEYRMILFPKQNSQFFTEYPDSFKKFLAH